MNEYPIQNLISEQYIVIVAATTGQGDEPDSMKTFWRFLLRKSLPPTSLSGVAGVAVFGLGDSSYAKFNYAAIKLHKRLGQLGARFVVGLGLADDQHPLGADGALEPWLDALWTNLLARIPLPLGQEIVPATVRAPPRFVVTAAAAEEHAVDEGLIKQPNAPLGAVVATMVQNRRITAETHFQDVRHITFDTGPELQHSPGDVLCVLL
jgi:sulfite reductase alpha subunit-like flavoprotein